MMTRYERDVPIFLSLYRFFAYGLAVIITQVLPLGSSVGPSSGTYTLLALMGLYTVLKVGGPMRAWRSGRSGLVLLWIDFILCLTILLGTGGLDSEYLLYSLTPLITASLLFTEWLSLALTSITAISVSVAHFTSIWWETPYAHLTSENRLFWLILFVSSAFLTATMVYRTNLNLRRRIEVTAVEEERKRMRRELHDGLAQSLGYMKMQTELVEKLIGKRRLQEAQSTLKDVLEAATNTYQEVRDSLDQLQAETGPIAKVLADYVNAFAERNGMATHFQASPPDVRLPAPMEFQLLRIVQEALSNVRRHSSATQTRVQLIADRSNVQLIVQDNGKGFDYVENGSSNSGHHGLSVDVLRSIRCAQGRYEPHPNEPKNPQSDENFDKSEPLLVPEGEGSFVEKGRKPKAPAAGQMEPRNAQPDPPRKVSYRRVPTLPAKHGSTAWLMVCFWLHIYPGLRR